MAEERLPTGLAPVQHDVKTYAETGDMSSESWAELNASFAVSEQWAGGDVAGGHGSDDAVTGVDYRDGAPSMVVDQLGRMVEIFFGGEEHGALHDVSQFEISVGPGEHAGRDEAKKSAFFGDDQMWGVGQLRCVSYPHVGAKRSGGSHDLVDASRTVLDDDRPAGGLGSNAGTGPKELALEPRPTGSTDDKERSDR